MNFNGYTVECRYNMVQYSKINKWLQGLQAEYHSDAGLTKDTPYLTLTGELWDVFCEYPWENWLHISVYGEKNQSWNSYDFIIFFAGPLIPVSITTSRQFCFQMLVKRLAVQSCWQPTTDGISIFLMPDCFEKWYIFLLFIKFLSTDSMQQVQFQAQWQQRPMSLHNKYHH